ncbi:MAG TPA: hypothetical protein VLM37_03430 [Fibrobacteraceae bacterium]|nr:hypothetical protein [Fibrobacteraceae bacterium]
MIQVNMLQEAGTFLSHQMRPEGAGRKPSGKRTVLTAFLLVVLLLTVGFAYILYSGVPKELLPYVPEPVLAWLDLEAPVLSSSLAPLKPASSGPAVAATQQPAVPGNNSVEDVVKTMRPDMFYARERKEYRQLLPSERILFQKMAVSVALTTFRTIVPSALGFSDLVFKIPDYYFVRGLASDSASIKTFLDSLQKRSAEFVQKPLSGEQKTLEFTAYGRLQLPAGVSGEKLAMLPASQITKELKGLLDLAQAQKVRFSGLNSPQITDKGFYRRVVYHAQTHADFPSLQQFAEAFRASHLRIGVLQMSVRPGLDEEPVTVFDFVLYTNPG